MYLNRCKDVLCSHERAEHVQPQFHDGGIESEEQFVQVCEGLSPKEFLEALEVGHLFVPFNSTNDTGSIRVTEIVLLMTVLMPLLSASAKSPAAGRGLPVASDVHIKLEAAAGATIDPR